MLPHSDEMFQLRRLCVMLENVYIDQVGDGDWPLASTVYVDIWRHFIMFVISFQRTFLVRYFF